LLPMQRMVYKQGNGKNFMEGIKVPRIDYAYLDLFTGVVLLLAMFFPGILSGVTDPNANVLLGFVLVAPSLGWVLFIAFLVAVLIFAFVVVKAGAKYPFLHELDVMAAGKIIVWGMASIDGALYAIILTLPILLLGPGLIGAAAWKQNEAIAMHAVGETGKMLASFGLADQNQISKYNYTYFLAVNIGVAFSYISLFLTRKFKFYLAAICMGNRY